MTMTLDFSQDLYTCYFDIDAHTEHELNEYLDAFDKLQAEAPESLGALVCETRHEPGSSRSILAVSCNRSGVRLAFIAFLATTTSNLRATSFPDVRCTLLDSEYSPGINFGQVR